MATLTTAAEAHFQETLRNASAWDRKPLLRAVYEEAYERIRAHLADGPAGGTVELGSGLGKIKTRIPHCVTTDLIESPFIDRVESAYALGFVSGSLSNLILVDVLHHLRYPGTALDEFLRVLRPGGRLILFEPAMSVLGRVVFGLLHREPLGERQPIYWRAGPEIDLTSQPYYAAQANCFRLFMRREFAECRVGWKTVRLDLFPTLAYIGSGGFSRPQLYPMVLLGAVRTLDRWLERFPSAFATRMVVVLEKE